jgi:putative membrane protein
MKLQALLAYVHYLSIITVIATLVVEMVVFEKVLSRKDIKKLQGADSLYGLAAIMVLATGTLRIMWYGKGWSYYLDNYFFITKLSLFLFVGLLSIYPTVAFLKWRKLPKDQELFTYDDSTYKKLLGFIRLEVILVFLIPLFAALMARGIGF